LLGDGGVCASLTCVGILFRMYDNIMGVRLGVGYGVTAMMASKIAMQKLASRTTSLSHIALTKRIAQKTFGLDSVFKFLTVYSVVQVRENINEAPLEIR
jgi:hypothetical protein